MALDKKLIEKIFYGIASLAGLCFTMIGTVGLLMLSLQLVLKAPRYPDYDTPPTPADYIGELRQRPELTEEQKAAVKQWTQEFNDWRATKKEFEMNGYRKTELATHLSFILVGTPIFLAFKSKFTKA
ncbi:MAG: hypothetical protein ABH814_00905 [bacterium]